VATSRPSVCFRPGGSRRRQAARREDQRCGGVVHGRMDSSPRDERTLCDGAFLLVVGGLPDRRPVLS
jgi:hypothetical protein